MSMHEVEAAIEATVRGLDRTPITDAAFRTAVAALYAFQSRFDTGETRSRVQKILERRGYRPDPSAEAQDSMEPMGATFFAMLRTLLSQTAARADKRRLARFWYALLLADAMMGGTLELLASPAACELRDEMLALDVHSLTGSEWTGMLALPSDDDLGELDDVAAAAVRAWLGRGSSTPLAPNGS